MKSIEQLRKKDLNCNIFSVYDYDGLTITELLCQFFTKINECIVISNETIDLAKWLVNEGLEIEVAKKLVMWLEDGTLENIINVNLFNSLNEKINGLSSQLEHIMVDVKQFGAKGDGLTNDSDSIQMFLNYCSDNQVKGKISSGVYILDKELYITSNTHILFDDGAIFKQTHDKTMINIKNVNHTKYNGYKNIKVENGYFDCNGGVIKNPMNCFFIQHASNVEFINCTFKNVDSYHALDINGSCDVRVLNCNFLNSYNSISKNDREAIQIDLSAPTEGEEELCWDYTPSKNILIENCYFGVDNLYALPYTCAVGSHNARYGKKYENIIVRNCKIEGMSKYGINGWKWSNCLIENNIIKGSDGGVKIETPGRNAMSCYDENEVYKGLEELEGNIIRNNKIIDVSREGIFLRGKYITEPNINEHNSGIISDCLIYNNYIKLKDSANPCIVLLNASKCKIEKNLMLENNSDSIRLYSSYENFVLNNNISKSGNYGISVSSSTLTGTDGIGKCDSNIIDSNIIKECKKTGVFITGEGSNCSVRNNIIMNCNTIESGSTSIIDISAKSNDIVVSDNKLIDNNIFKNLIFITNTCKRILVTNNISNTGEEGKYFNDSINGLLINNI